ncbi:MAG: RpiB/LacA/LacB family sugar-phosphate isomerase [bacterium]
MHVAVSADERAPIVEAALAWLTTAGHTPAYFGPTAAGEEQDWPVVTRAAAAAVARGEAELGIVFCFTGTGASIAANKVPGIRAALCGDAETARGARKWNHANVLALSIRLTSPPLLGEILTAFFGEPLSDDDWNRRQIARIASMDRVRTGE